jgi:asparagine synthase (glutamine-hydrolysing)
MRPAAVLEEELVAHLREAVRSRMVADVPLGAFLSGGVDSSAVVALMAEASRQRSRPARSASTRPIMTRPATPPSSPSGSPRTTAPAIVASADFSLLDRLAEAFDEPFADASAIGTYRVAELARERVKVALSGDGADEAFAGYRRYRLFVAEEKARRLLPPGARSVLGAAGSSIPSSTGRRNSSAPRPA